jgi:hypothetical protein
MKSANCLAPAWIRNCWRAHQSRIITESCAVEWTESMEEWERCWCCGASEGKRLQRCHIVAKSIGGIDHASNIVPLCRHCHDLMPDTPDPEYFWRWLKKQQNPLSGLGLGRYWVIMESASAALKQKDLSSVDASISSSDQIKSKIKALLEKSAIHWSQSGKGPTVKLSTIEWAVHCFINELPTP